MILKTKCLYKYSKIILITKKRRIEIAKDNLYDKADSSSSDELLDSINALKESMDAMLKLFTEAANDIGIEEKLDEIINQNKIMIDKLAALSSNTKDFAQKPQPSFNFPKPSFQPAPQPRFQQPPGFQQSFREPNQQEMDELPELKELEQAGFEEPFDKPQPMPRQQGPVAMPSIPFSSFNEPKRKGLFGRLKR